MKAPISKETRKENRKINHSLIEKKRRNKMNECLRQLNRLVPTCANIENLHKLDVLEMTVQYILEIQNKNVDSLESQAPAASSPTFQASQKGRIYDSCFPSPKSTYGSSTSSIASLAPSLNFNQSMPSPKSESGATNMNKMSIRNLLC